jgi:uncharacterized protein YcbK (DUF882 family)
MLTYSYKYAAEKRLSPHFRVREFHSKHDPSDLVKVDEKLLTLLENIRNHTGKPVHINSGYRSPEYNATLKNASPRSQHCNGKAADIWVEGVTPKQIADIAECYLGSSGGIGIYKTFTHVDVRTSCARWKGAY